MPPKRPVRNRQKTPKMSAAATSPAVLVPAIPSSSLSLRNPAMDSVRGLAIVLMVIDHISGILANVPISPETLRFGTRLSLPLFAVLIGYFFGQESKRELESGVDESRRSNKRRQRLIRLGQILLAAAITNFLTWPALHKLEILASFAVVYGFYLLLGRHIQWLLIGLPLYAYDPSIDYFDYPVLLVASLVATGTILATRQLRIALLISLVMIAVGTPLIPPPSIYVVWFLPPALSIVAAASHWRELQHPWLAALGRIPLTAYVLQYAVIMLIRWVWQR